MRWRAEALSLVVVCCGLGCDNAGQAPDPDVRVDLAVDQGLDADPQDGPHPDAAADLGADMATDRAEPPDAAVDIGRPDVEPVVHLALGEHPPGARIDFDLPEGYSAVLLQARGTPARLYTISDLRGPDGSQLVGALPGEGPLRVSANPGAAVALLPNTDDARLALEPGPYSFSITADGPTPDLPVEAWLVAPGPGARVQVNVLIPPATGIDPQGVPVTEMIRFFEQQFSQAFAAEVQAIPRLVGAEAPADLVLDSAAGDLSGLAALAAAAADLEEPGLDLFLVGEIVDGGNRQSGFSGGLPAPVDMRGAPASAIVVRTPLLEDFPHAVADLAVHELGHALGLYHTTEPFGDPTDPILDTPECPLACDADGDGIVFARECGAQDTGEPPCNGASDNLMFWTLGGRRDVTRGQRQVVQRHPILRLTPPAE